MLDLPCGDPYKKWVNYVTWRGPAVTGRRLQLTPVTVFSGMVIQKTTL
ncbi:hypothetical protein ETAE_3350 [Edwardsiella piscicida]|uniref:Uncharacterized protein n=1 Tax=Edwardsiella piscicida TaxID=1263550 RepID=A0AAU8P676_EDWPI|nr:hypothetical protein ETAE_3350 [Edwardsiella tarda EIB202]